MMRFPISIIFISMWACSISLAETPASLFQRGVEAFRQDDWQGAIDSWHRVEDQGFASGALYYNLGNAYYRLGRIGKSVVYFERALRLLPRDPDVQQNLNFVRLATIDRVESPVRLAIWDWVERLRDAVSLFELARALVCVGFGAAVAIASWKLSPAQSRTSVKLIAIALLAAYTVSLGWYAWRLTSDSEIRAIVQEAKTDVYSAPDSAATLVFFLHEGTEVRQQESMAGWLRVVLRDGRTGWLPASAVEKL